VCCLAIIERPGAKSANSYYVTRLLRTAWHAARYRLRHSEITAFCRLLWLCAAAALDETNDSSCHQRQYPRLAAGLGRRLPAYTLRYRDTLADDIVIQFFSYDTSPKQYTADRDRHYLTRSLVHRECSIHLLNMPNSSNTAL